MHTPRNIAILLLLTAALAVPATATEPENPAEILKGQLARREGGADLKLLSARRVELPGGDFVDQGAFLSEDGRRLEKVLLRGSTGEPLTILELQRLEQQDWEAEHGKLSPRLVERLASPSRSAESAPIAVLVWTPWPAMPDKPRHFSSTEEARQWRTELQKARVRKLAVEQAALKASLPSLGARLVDELEGMPMLEVELPADRLRELAARDDVGRIDLPVTEADARATHAATWFWDADDAESIEAYTMQGYYGAGINVGVYEAADYCGLWRESSTTPAGFSNLGSFTQEVPVAAVKGCDVLPDGAECNSPCSNDKGFCRNGHCYKEHVTMVASKLGSARDGEHRNASSMNLFFSNDGNKEHRLSWLNSHGVTIVNDSEGAANDPAVNWSIRNLYISLTKSVGNSWMQQVDCYDNSICVGSYSIVSTANIDAWKTDPQNLEGEYQLSGSTQWLEHDTRWDAEKPDVMGNGEASLMSVMITPRTQEWLGFPGTSFAAPMVGGQIAVLQEYFPTAQNWPELVRPMILTSGISHNLLDASLSRNGGQDEIDGAGIPTSSMLKQIVDDGTYSTLSLTPALFDGQFNYTPPGAQVTLQPGETVRAVLGWMYCVENGVNLLSADYDLYLEEQGTGTLVDWSISDTNSLEMVQFTNDSSQARSYDLVIKNQGMTSCQGLTQEYAGLAWTVTADDLGPSRHFDVNEASDTDDSDCDTDCTLSNDPQCDRDCTLREALDDANAYPGRDLINLDSLSYGISLLGGPDDFNASGDFDVRDDVTIRGKGRTASVISGSGLDRVLHVLPGADLQLEGMSLLLGNPGGPGGGLRVDGSATLDDVLVYSNSATQGGGIFSDGGAVTLRDSQVLGNTASTDGGGIYVANATLDVFDSEIEGNTAANGGGLYNTFDTFAWIRNSTIIYNDATAGKGGGIRNFADLQLDSSTVTGNSAAFEGGGIWNVNGGTTSLVYSTVADNIAPAGSAYWSQGVLATKGSLIAGTCAGTGSVASSQSTLESPGDTCGLDPLFNRVEVPDLHLSELSYYGGPTRTRPPLSNSPAVDPDLPLPLPAPDHDQRGLVRPLAAGSGVVRYDSGSVEHIYIDLSWGSKTLLEWTAPPIIHSSWVYRGNLSDLLDADNNGRPDYGYGDCQVDNYLDQQFSEGGNPPPGSGWYYLVEPNTDAGRTGIGWNSGGLKRNPATGC